MNRAYSYPPALRVLGLLGSMFAGAILLGSVLAEIEAADVPDLIVHGLGAIAGAVVLWLGLEFGMRRVILAPDGLTTRLLRERSMGWGDVRGARDGLFGTLIIRPKHGLPIVIWPFMVDLNALHDALTRSVSQGE